MSQLRENPGFMRGLEFDHPGQVRKLRGEVKLELSHLVKFGKPHKYW